MLVFAAPAGAAIRWQTVADGIAGGDPSAATTGYVVYSRAGALTQFSARLTKSGASELGKVDFRGNALVAIFGEFGCVDHLVAVESIAQAGKSLDVRLLEESPKPGTAVCMAIYPTYRFLLISKSALSSPLPTHAVVTVARS